MSSNRRAKPYSVVPDQSTHNTGGAIMGADPKTSAVNKYLQSWDVPNVFVIGSSAFPQNAGYNPNGTVCALAFLAADAIISKYLKVSRPVGADVRRALTALLRVAAGRRCAACGRRRPRGRPAVLRYSGTRKISCDGRRLRGLPYQAGRQAVCGRRRACTRPSVRLVGPNITPDPEAGIGSWTDDEFVSALHDGRGRGGIHLYPAMPYPAYTKMTRDDALAIRAYLRTIDPAPDKIESNQLPFPFNIRSTMIVWNAINFTPGRLASGSVQIRAVEPRALSCRCARSLRHLPYAEDHHGSRRDLGLSARRPLQGWYAPNITADSRKGIGSWSVDDIVTYLKTGANRDAMASGGMGEEVVHSSSHMTDDDLKAIAVYLLSLKPAARTEPAGSCGHRCAHAGRSGDLQRQLRRLPYRRWNGGRSPLSAPRRKFRGAVR